MYVYMYYKFVACKVCYHVLVVTFPMPHDRGCEIKIIVIVIEMKSVCSSMSLSLSLAGHRPRPSLCPWCMAEWVSTRSFFSRMRGNQLAYSSHYK